MGPSSTRGWAALLWFHDCACPEDVAARVRGVPRGGAEPTCGAGVAFAATYVGGADPDELCGLAAHASADGFRAHVSQGAAFAIATRRCRRDSVPEQGGARRPAADGGRARAGGVVDGHGADRARPRSPRPMRTSRPGTPTLAAR
ncbi:DUF1702 family protein [Nonomuraea dietziae]|uniref:DUF1702 family protein n=1 Tax=Nonomuraea dietziae TaxID=65515 RepID=UPI003CD053B8